MYHIYRVHFQVAEWRSLLSTGLRAEDWGWKLRDRHLIPIPMNIEVAPANILNVVRCKCRIDTHGPCTSML